MVNIFFWSREAYRRCSPHQLTLFHSFSFARLHQTPPSTRTPPPCWRHAATQAPLIGSSGGQHRKVSRPDSRAGLLSSAPLPQPCLDRISRQKKAKTTPPAEPHTVKRCPRSLLTTRRLVLDVALSRLALCGSLTPLGTGLLSTRTPVCVGGTMPQTKQCSGLCEASTQPWCHA